MVLLSLNISLKYPAEWGLLFLTPSCCHWYPSPDFCLEAGLFSLSFKSKAGLFSLSFKSKAAFPASLEDCVSDIFHTSTLAAQYRCQKLVTTQLHSEVTNYRSRSKWTVGEQETPHVSRSTTSASGTIVPEAGREVITSGGATYPLLETSEKTFMLVSARPQGTR